MCHLFLSFALITRKNSNGKPRVWEPGSQVFTDLSVELAWLYNNDRIQLGKTDAGACMYLVE